MSNEAEKCWLIQSGSEPAGPYSLAQLRSLARSGRITRSTLIRDLQSSGWLVAGQLPELFQQALPTIKAADQTKPKRQPTTPTHPASPIMLASPERVSMLPPMPTELGQHATPATGRPAIIVAAIAGAVGSAVVVLLVVVSLQRTTAGRPNPSAELEDAKTQSVAAAPVGNIDALTGGATKPATVYSTEDVVALTQASVAAVYTRNGALGSGFMVDRNVLATNYHVIADSPSAEISAFFPDGDETKRGPFAAVVIAEQPGRDLALLRIDAEIPPLDVYPNYRFRRGQDIVIIGSPSLFRGEDFLPNAVTRGVLSSQADLNGFEHYQLSLAVNSGNSGGPVLGLDGRVIGVVVSKSLTEDSIGFCIPAPDLDLLIKSQASSRFADSSESSAIHDARAVVRSVFNHNLNREKLMAGIISQTGFQPMTVSATSFVNNFTRTLQDDAPDLFRRYDGDLNRIATDSRLPVDVRRAFVKIHQRQVTIERMLNSPSGNVDQFFKKLTLANGDFFDDVQDLDNTLELGRLEWPG